MMSNYFWTDWRRYPSAGFLGGVCAGIAHRFDWNPRVIRVIALLSIIPGLVFPVTVGYCVLWYLMEASPGHPGQFDKQGSASDIEPATPQELRKKFSGMESRIRNMEACVASSEFELRREISKL